MACRCRPAGSHQCPGPGAPELYSPPVDHATRAESESYSLREPTKFDPQKLYRQPVVLISFNDRDFSMPDPKSYYHRLFNEQGFNSGKGLGCLGLYIRRPATGQSRVTLVQ